MNSKLTNEEIIKAKLNTYILLSISGNGKSTLVNLLCKANAKVSNSQQSVTSEVTSYNGKLDNGEYFCIVDTPGFFDYKGINKDKENYESIKSYLISNNLLIKGIYILCNFQNERFNDAEQKCVKAISDIFPIKNFWNFVTIVFTHYFDKGLNSRVKIKKSNDFQNSLKITKEKLIKDICDRNKIDSVSQDKIKTIYVDIYNDIEEEEKNINKYNLDEEELEDFEKNLNNKKAENEKSYNELTKDIKEKNKKPPLYDKVEFFDNIKATLYEENHSTFLESYDLYEAYIEKRIFYLNGNVVSCDIKLKSEPKFVRNVNKLLKNFKEEYFVPLAIGCTAYVSLPLLYLYGANENKENNKGIIKNIIVGFNAINKIFISNDEYLKNQLKNKIFDN